MSMNIDDEERRVQESVNSALDESLSSIDQSTQAGLRQSRMQALALAERPRIWQSMLKPLPIASALAFSFALIISLPQWQSSPSSNGTSILAQQQEFDDLLLLSDIDNDILELVEDLEFALWLTEEMDMPNEGLEFEEQASNYSVQKMQSETRILPEVSSVLGCVHV
jgi:hypothetical protein